MRRPAPDGRTRLSLPSRRDLLHDLVAGLTVGASQVGNAMAYTMLAGVPPVHGLYAVAAGTPAGALTAGSQRMPMVPTAALCLAAGGALARFRRTGASPACSRWPCSPAPSCWCSASCGRRARAVHLQRGDDRPHGRDRRDHPALAARRAHRLLQPLRQQGPQGRRPVHAPRRVRRGDDRHRARHGRPGRRAQAHPPQALRHGAAAAGHDGGRRRCFRWTRSRSSATSRPSRARCRCPSSPTCRWSRRCWCRRSRW